MSQPSTQPLRTGPVFERAAHPFGQLWATVSELEDDLAEHLLKHPVGAVIAWGNTAWMLAPSEEGLTLMGGAFVDGELEEPQSRFDYGLDVVDVAPTDLELHIETLRQALKQLEAGHSLLLPQTQQLPTSRDHLADLRAAVLQRDAQAIFLGAGVVGRHYVGPIVATLGGSEPGFAQHLGRGIYTVHDVIPPVQGIGDVVEVKYHDDLAASVNLSKGQARER